MVSMMLSQGIQIWLLQGGVMCTSDRESVTELWNTPMHDCFMQCIL